MKTKKDLQLELKVSTILIITLLSIITILYFQMDKEKNICYDFLELKETLNEINKNCKSTFITKKWNDDNWFVTDSSGKDIVYHKLEDCLS